MAGCSKSEKTDIQMAISPYQDLAMMINIYPLGLDRKYGTSVNIKTIPWQDTLPALASAGGDIDIGFASLTEFLAKEENLNKGSKDPLLFIFPAYVFKGGAFITFRKDMKPIFHSGSFDNAALRNFLQSRIGLSKNTLYEMLVYQFARNSNIPPNRVNIIDIPFDEGLLATEKGDLDVAAVGLTQLTEALKRGGRILFDMDEIGFADITGFVCKKSTLEKKQKKIENVIRMWFDATAYVMSNLDTNSRHSLDYLRRNSATRYTIEEYKRALGQEYFPTTVSQAARDMISPDGRYAYQKIYEAASDFLVTEGAVSKRPDKPQFIQIGDK
jgi:ABC-type nitrate/sulfonate/bicarbonate transport system substrate-binding protein